MEKYLDYSDKRMRIGPENQDALGISAQEMKGCATWSHGKSSCSQDLIDKTKRLKYSSEQKGVLQKVLYREII